MIEAYRTEVAWSDEDSQGHVNHAAIIRWLAEARIRFLDRVPRPARIDYVLVDLKINFPAEITYPGEVTVMGEIVAVGTKSVTSRYEVLFNGAVAARAECKNVFFDTLTGGTVAAPEGYRA